MPEQGRVGGEALVRADSHGWPGCAHTCVGPAVAGSSDVFVNKKPALRVGDPGVHSACCGPNTWKAAQGSTTVFFNGIPAHRLGDQTAHCGGSGTLIVGSDNVIVGGAATAPAPAPSTASSEGAPALAHETGTGKGSSGFTPKKTDKYIQDKYGDYLPEGKKTGNLAADNTTTLPDKELQNKYLSYGGDPQKAKRINGFALIESEKAYLNEDKMNGGTAYHESLHLYSDKNYYREYGTNINEGTTEYLTKKGTGPRGIDRSMIYSSQEKAIAKLSDKVGDDAIKKAYFQGKTNRLKKWTDKKLGDGTWDKFEKSMKNKEYEKAEKALD